MIKIILDFTKRRNMGPLIFLCNISVINSFWKMKNQVPIKLFKRKTSSLNLMQVDRKRESLKCMESDSKFLSPQNVKGLDSTMYKKEQAVVRGLQEELNRLRQKATKLEEQNSKLRDQNDGLRQENWVLKKNIEQHKQLQKRSINEQVTTVDVLNQLKQKIESLSDDHLSTVDQIDLQELCRCHQYQGQIMVMKEKVRFLQESLLHSQVIISKFQEEIRRIKLTKADRGLTQEEFGKVGSMLRKLSAKQKGRPRLSLIDEIIEVNED